MRGRLLYSMVIIIVVMFSMGGGVVAWFTHETSADMQVFTVGYLRISPPELISETGEWKAGETVELTYSMENLGDQEVYVRVMPVAEYIGSITRSGNPFSIAVSEPEWISTDSVYWYYGQLLPLFVSPGQSIQITYEITMADDADGRVSFSLETEAIQVSANSVVRLWPGNPW